MEKKTQMNPISFGSQVLTRSHILQIHLRTFLFLIQPSPFQIGIRSHQPVQLVRLKTISQMLLKNFEKKISQTNNKLIMKEDKKKQKKERKKRGNYKIKKPNGPLMNLLKSKFFHHQKKKEPFHIVESICLELEVLKEVFKFKFVPEKNISR